MQKVHRRRIRHLIRINLQFFYYLMCSLLNDKAKEHLQLALQTHSNHGSNIKYLSFTYNGNATGIPFLECMVLF